MTDFLLKLVNRGFVPKLEGDDLKLAKIQKASNALAAEFARSPRRLIRAILAGIEPDVSDKDPEIVAAEQAVLQQWGTMRTVHTDSPTNLLRAVLLDACFQAAQGPRAAVVWLTIVDQLPFVRLGAEETTVRNQLDTLAISVENQALAGLGGEKPKQVGSINIGRPNLAGAQNLTGGDMAALSERAKSAFPFTQQSGNWQLLADAVNVWMNAFPDQLSGMLAALHRGIVESVQLDRSQLITAFADATAIIEKTVNDQREWLFAAQADFEASSRIRLEALWWAEALYSPSLQISYRQIPSTLATFVMAFDLAAVVGVTAPASVGFLLAETIAKLPSAGFDEARPLGTILDGLREHRGRLPAAWLDQLESPTEGSLSIRDLAVLSLRGDSIRYENAKNEFSSRFEKTMNLPDFGHAIHRQERACRIVQELK
ncbi:GTPase-associated system all-helical protein GASH [Nannocystaceae bacterium ST9]